MNMVLLCNVLFIMFDYMLIDERGEKFVNRLKELSKEGWFVHSYAIACNNYWTTRSALMYKLIPDEIVDDKEEVEETIIEVEEESWPEQLS